MPFAEVVDVRPDRLEDPQSEYGPVKYTSARSKRLVDFRTAVSMAANCKWVSPKVGDSGGALARGTESAGECSRTPSMTQVR